ncbi:hypothetical protein C8Q73DRAFT_631531, partial [Cubamyces lactineus]
QALFLPSEFKSDERTEFCLERLAGYELKIRIGLAFDQLEAVRMAVKYRAAHIEHKKKSVRTNKANAHAEMEIKQAEHRARRLGSEYNDNYARICTLRPVDYEEHNDQSAGRRLQEINLDTDLTIVNMAAARTIGDSTKTGSWICVLADVVQWFRAKASKDRADGGDPGLVADEAVNKICADFRRTCLGFSAYADLWCQAAARSQGGERAYASKTAAMWSRMQRQCQEHYDRSRKAGVPAEQLDQTRVSV